MKLQVTASPPTTVGYQVFANVYIGNATIPTGTVTFQLFGVNDPNCVSEPVFTSSVVVAGMSVNSDHYTTPLAGTYHWEASYSGDADNAAAGPTACSEQNADVLVSGFYTNVALTAGRPSGGTIRASVNLYAFNPTGTLTFFLTPPGDLFCSGTPVFTSTVTVNGGSDYTSAPYTFPVGGLYKWRVIYSGDYNNLGGPITGCLDVNAAVIVSSFATFSYPVNGQTDVNADSAFTWQPVLSASAYFLTVGTTFGGWDLAWSGILPASQSSYDVGALPSGPLYATLYTQVLGLWNWQVIAFTAVATEAALNAPLSGQTNVDPSAPITWTTVAGVQGYALWVSTVYGSANVLSTALLPATQASLTPATPLPANQVLYAILFTERNDVWTSQAVTFSTFSRSNGAGDRSSVQSGPPPCSAGSTIPACPGTSLSG